MLEQRQNQLVIEPISHNNVASIKESPTSYTLETHYQPLNTQNTNSGNNLHKNNKSNKHIKLTNNQTNDENCVKIISKSLDENVANDINTSLKHENKNLEKIRKSIDKSNLNNNKLVIIKSNENNKNEINYYKLGINLRRNKMFNQELLAYIDVCLNNDRNLVSMI